MKTMKTIQISALAVIAFAGNAHAHATFTQPTVTAESYAVMQLQVPHGCDGKATNEVRIQLPEGFVFAQPQPKAGWQIEIIKGEYEKSYDSHGTAVTEGPVEIRWKGGDLPDEYYDTFVVRGKISGVEPGTELAFPSTQLCGSDASVAWTEVAAPGTSAHSLNNPAPVVTVVAKQSNGHASAPVIAPVKVGNLELEGAFTKAMLPGQPVGGGFVTIRNTGSEDDTLLSGASPIAGAVELHEMAMQGEIMKMRKLDSGIPVAAGATVEMKPGGLHMMFMKVTAPFKEGGRVLVTLTFEKAGTVEIELPVQAAGPAGHSHH